MAKSMPAGLCACELRQVGVGKFSVNPRFHPTPVSWNLKLTREFPTSREGVMLPGDEMGDGVISGRMSDDKIRCLGSQVAQATDCQKELLQKKIILSRGHFQCHHRRNCTVFTILSAIE